jgi:L-asparagine transporter-like permease
MQSLYKETTVNFREFKEARKARREKYPRLALALSVLGAAVSTYAALPAPGKHLRLVIVLTIIATWLAVVISAVKLAAARRRNKMEN